MKKILSLLPVLLLAVMVLGTAGCSKKNVLHVYCWEDYIAEDLLKQFEQENNCIVQVDIFPSNEAMYAKIKAGAAGYDLIVPSAYMAKLMDEQQMLEKIDLNKLPTFKQFYDNQYDVIALDKTHDYSIPYFISFTGIGYDSSKVTDFKPTWRMFEREDLKGKLSLLDDQRGVIGCALKTLGFDVNTTNQDEIDQAVALARKWKENIAKFGVDDSRASLAQGEFFLIQTYSGDLLQYAVDNPNLKFVIPEEGTTATFDTLVIMKDSTNKDLAYKFMDFLYRTENAVANMDEIYYRMAHKEAVKLVSEDIRDNPVFNIPESMFEKCSILRDMGKDKVKFDRAWDEIKK